MSTSFRSADSWHRRHKGIQRSAVRRLSPSVALQHRYHQSALLDKGCEPGQLKCLRPQLGSFKVAAKEADTSSIPPLRHLEAACPNGMRLEAQRRFSRSSVAVDAPLGNRICGTLMPGKRGREVRDDAEGGRAVEETLAAAFADRGPAHSALSNAASACRPGDVPLAAAASGSFGGRMAERLMDHLVLLTVGPRSLSV